LVIGLEDLWQFTRTTVHQLGSCQDLLAFRNCNILAATPQKVHHPLSTTAFSLAVAAPACIFQIMGMDKARVAEILNEIAVMLELNGENPFKSRAYVNAARVVESLNQPIEIALSDQGLDGLPGIGDAIAKKIRELVTTGTLSYYEDLKASTPPGLLAMLAIPGLGPKKIRALRQQLSITTIEQLEKACQDGKVAELRGFGRKTQENICAGIQRRRSYAERHLLIEGWLLAEPIMEALRAHPDVIRCSTAGSLRRVMEVIGDLDVVVSSNHPARVIDFFTHLPGVSSVLAKGQTKASVLFNGSVQSDLRVVADSEFPFALMYFTGSKEHNVVMRRRAIQRGLRLNEYGLFRSSQETRDPELLVPCRSEDEIFAELGLSYIPPELREDKGEFALAEIQPVPRLIEWTDLRGSLHNHSVWSDGHNRLDEIVACMRDLGFQYWAVTDHSQSSWQANGLDEQRLLKQIREIREINSRLQDEGAEFRLLTGIEVDILVACKLDLPDDLLSKLDVVVASIHQGFGQSESDNTKRLICAAQNRWVHILAHPTGRLLLDREPYKVNVQAVIDACAETGTWIELNCSPRRFDLDWRHWPYARSKGVKCVINPDAHRNEHAGYLRLGASIARKGWLRREDVVNTLPGEKLEDALRRKGQALK
jgi:DNA polymerase (family X)